MFRWFVLILPGNGLFLTQLRLLGTGTAARRLVKLGEFEFRMQDICSRSDRRAGDRQGR